MKQSNQSISLHNRLVRSVIALSTLVVLITSIAILYMVDRQGTQVIADETRAWANSLARNNIHYLHKDNGQVELQEQLKKLITTPLINHIHFYRINEYGAVEYFSSYNRNHNFPPISERISDISRLSSVQYEENNLELIVKIIEDKKIIGYVFIQTSLLEKQVFVKKLIYVMVAFLLLSMVISFSVAHSLFKDINRPLVKLIDEIGNISQTRNYHSQLAPLPYKEIDGLTKNVNVLLRRIESHINSLLEEHEHTKVKNTALEDRLSSRTDALKESNNELLSTLEKLHQFQDQLVETEKMASLGDMVAGIAHEVNTPIGLGVTASSVLADRLHDIKTAFEEKTLKSSQLKKFLNDSKGNTELILRNLERAAQLISSFKKVAVDQSSADNRVFNVNELIDEVLLTLLSKITPANVDVVVDCPAGLVVNSKPGPLNQILINLILNSIYHGFENREHGKITINIMNFGDQLYVNYSDDGVGIDEVMKHKIFEPFTTTKRGSGGSGLGMHLVYNLVTQALGGNITIEEKHDQGVSFDITFPVELMSS